MQLLSFDDPCMHMTVSDATTCAGLMLSYGGSQIRFPFCLTSLYLAADCVGRCLFWEQIVQQERFVPRSLSVLIMVYNSYDLTMITFLLAA